MKNGIRKIKSPVWRIVFSLIFVVPLFFCLCGLGSWQVQRALFKNSLLLKIEKRSAELERTLEDIEEQFRRTQDVDYEPVFVKGILLHEYERYVFTVEKGEVGFYVYVPLKIKNSRMILINLGFIPDKMKNERILKKRIREKSILIKGLARNPLKKKPSFFIPNHNYTEHIFYWKDYNGIKKTIDFLERYDCVPFFIENTKKENKNLWPRAPERPIVQNNHVQYAVTWYCLAFFLVLIWCVQHKSLFSSIYRKNHVRKCK